MDLISAKSKNNAYVNNQIANEDQLSYEIITDEAEFDALKEEWNKLVDDAKSQIFQTFEWQRYWWKYYGESTSKLNIVLFRKSDELVAILPTFIDTFQIWGKSVYRCLRFIGSSVMQPHDSKMIGLIAYTDYLDIIVDPAYKNWIIQAVCEYLYTYRTDIDRIVLDEIPEDSLLLDIAESFTEESTPYWNVTLHEASVCPVIKLPGTWNKFLNKLSSNARYQIRSDVKKVYDDKRKLFDIKKIESGSDRTAAYNVLTAYHQERWNRKGFPGAFADSKRYHFLKDVMDRFHERGCLLFLVLTPRDEPDEYLALDILFQYKEKTYLIERAFNANSPLSDEGPGNVLLYSVIKNKIEKGEKAYDFLRGDEDYKLRTANHLVQNSLLVMKPAIKSLNTQELLFDIIRIWVDVKRRLIFEAEMFKAQLQYNGYIQSIIRFVRLITARLYDKMIRGRQEIDL